MRAVADEQLLAAVLAGERGAWAAFTARFERLIVGCVRRAFARHRAAGSDEDVEDVVSAVCLSLLRDDHAKLRRFDPARGYQVSSWIGLIATRAALDALRRRPPAHVALDADLPAADDPQAVLLAREDRAALRAAIAELSPAEREFLVLCYDDELPPEEIARRLAISVNTVYSRKTKLRDKLRGKVRRDRA